MKKIIIGFYLCFSILLGQAQNQGITNIWLMGYESNAGPPSGTTKINFYTGLPVITYDSLQMDFDRTHANISDSAGNILFYTNGYYIADATNDTMLNGSNISPTGFIVFEPYGLTVPQANLIIPKPGSTYLYYLFHSTLDNGPVYNRAYQMYYSIIDMSLNNGNGEVIQKNTVLINDTLNPGKITACKHANGRDWWVICHRFNTNDYYKILVTPDSIYTPVTQTIGSVRGVDAGQVAFSPDGNKFGYFNAYNNSNCTLDIYDFDRCTGNFSNPTVITMPQTIGFGGGVIFSPNSQYLYVSDIDSVFQFDVNAPNIELSKVGIAGWDSFYSPNPPFATAFDNIQLAPDGKIYIGTGNSTFKMHVINHPNIAGLACDLQQHAINIPTWSVGGVPNHPNYFLGPELGSVCDSLPHVGIAENKPEPIPRAFPNPTGGEFTLWFNVHDVQGMCEIYDANGRLVLSENVAQWSQYKTLDISGEPEGIYFVKMNWGKKCASVKVMKE